MTERQHVKLPAGAAELISNAEAAVKDAPEHFIGRKDELRRYKRAIRDSVKPQPNHPSTPGITITAAPGAGKTSVITELTKQLREDDIAVALIHAQDLKTPQALATALKGQPPWNRKDWWERLGVNLAHGLSGAADISFQSTLNYAAVKVGLPPEVPDLGIAKGLAERWLAEPAPTIADTLQMLDIGSGKGAVIIVDEAQQVHDFAERSGAARDCIESVINALATPSQRNQKSIARSSIVLTGLSDTRRMVKATGSWGLNPHVLAPLPRADVQELIRHHVRLGAGGDAGLSAAAEREWIQPLTDQFGDWTRHAQAAAQAAQLVLETCGEAAVRGNGLYATGLLADRFRQDVYQNVMDAAEDDGVTKEIIDLVAHAFRRNQNRISNLDMTQLIRCAVKEGWHQILNEESAILITTNRLLRAGIMDRTAEIKQITESGFYYSPIPSLLRAITKERPEPNSDELRLIAAADLRTAPPPPHEPVFQPDWSKLNQAEAQISRLAAGNPELASWAKETTEASGSTSQGKDFEQTTEPATDSTSGIEAMDDHARPTTTSSDQPSSPNSTPANQPGDGILQRTDTSVDTDAQVNHAAVPTSHPPGASTSKPRRSLWQRLRDAWAALHDG